MSESRFDLITLQIQIVGVKTIFCCLVTERHLNNYWEVLAYEVSENIERAQVSENISDLVPLNNYWDNVVIDKSHVDDTLKIRSNLPSLIKFSWLYSQLDTVDKETKWFNVTVFELKRIFLSCLETVVQGLLMEYLYHRSSRTQTVVNSQSIPLN